MCSFIWQPINEIVTRNETDFKRSKLPGWSPEHAIHFDETIGQ